MKMPKTMKAKAMAIRDRTMGRSVRLIAMPLAWFMEIGVVIGYSVVPVISMPISWTEAASVGNSPTMLP